MKFVFVVVILVFAFLSAEAQTASATSPAATKKPLSKPQPPWGREAIVIIDSAMVYDLPSFDGAVIDYLSQGQKVRISQKAVSRDIGRFYQIKLKNNKMGYIADIDVKPMKKKKSPKDEDENEERNEKLSPEERKRKEEQDRKEKEQKEREEREEREEEKREARERANRAPLAFTTMVGPYYASWGMKEKIGGIKAEEQISVFGIKYTTPNLTPGAVIDLNLGFSPGAPDYYQQISQTKPKGYILLIDAEFLSPMVLAQDSFGYLGLGPLINYTSVRIQSLGAAVDSNDLRLGLVISLGYSHRFGSLAARLEGRYIIEKTQQPVLLLTLQMPL